MRSTRLWAVAAAVIVSLVIGYGVARVAFNPQLLDRYVSDEAWYVPAARNLLYLAGLEPRPCRRAYATLFYNNTSVLSEYAPPGAKILESATAAVVGWPAPPGLGARETRCCWSYPNAAGIDRYLNLEHPPLAKYIVALAMLVGGDCPLYWRLPVVILVTLAAGILAYTVVVATARWLGDSVAPAAAVLEAILSAVLLRFSSLPVDAVAMLEGFVAGFGMLSVAAMLSGRRRLAYTLATLATLSKYTGAAYLVGVALADRLERGWRSVAKGLLLSAVVALLVYAPLAALLGPERLIRETIGGLEWFLESRPPGPPPSNPLDWLLGRNPFPLSIEPRVVAAPNPVLFAAGLAAGVYLLLVSPRRPRAAALGAPVPVFTALMSLVYLAGNHTLYSFYAGAVEPEAPAAAATVLAYLVSRPRAALREALEAVPAWASLPEARIASRLLGPRGAPLAAVAVLVALGEAGRGSGVFAYAEPHSRLGLVALTAALLLLGATAAAWRRVEPGAAAAASLASGGYLSAASLLMLVLGAESPAAGMAAPLVYAGLASIAYTPPPYTLGAVAAYAAARLLGLAPPPGMLDYAALLAASVFLGVIGEPPATIYAAMAILEPGAALAAAALLAGEERLAALAVLEAAGYAAKPPVSTILLALGFAASIARDVLVVRRRVAGARASRTPRTRLDVHLVHP